MKPERREKQGNWLFQRRSFIPLIVIGIGGLLYVLLLHFNIISLYPWWVDCLFLGVGFFGLGIRIFTVGFTPKGTSGRNTNEGQIAETLNTKGIYSIVRHPLYVGNFFMWLAPVLMLKSFSLIGFILIFFVLFYDRIIFAEEQFLKRKFGQNYAEWFSKTPAVFPKFSLYQKSDLQFSIKNVLKREYNSFFSLVFTMTLIRIIGLSITNQKLFLDIPWLIIISVSFIIFISLKMIKKYTKILEVEGR